MTWPETAFWIFILALLFSPWDRIWNKLLGNSADDDEENEMDCANVDENEIGQMKLECLKLAAANGAAGEAAIIQAAQKFWDFILKPDETPDED